MKKLLDGSSKIHEPEPALGFLKSMSRSRLKKNLIGKIIQKI